jgi:hypothetical protein
MQPNAAETEVECFILLMLTNTSQYSPTLAHRAPMRPFGWGGYELAKHPLGCAWRWFRSDQGLTASSGMAGLTRT